MQKAQGPGVCKLPKPPAFRWTLSLSHGLASRGQESSLFGCPAEEGETRTLGTLVPSACHGLSLARGPRAPSFAVLVSLGRCDKIPVNFVA